MKAESANHEEKARSQKPLTSWGSLIIAVNVRTEVLESKGKQARRNLLIA